MEDELRCLTAGQEERNRLQYFSLDSYRLVCPVDSNEEEEFCHKQADAQVFMDSIPVTLESAEEAESKDTEQEADQGEENADPGNDIQQQVMDCITML